MVYVYAIESIDCVDKERNERRETGDGALNSKLYMEWRPAYGMSLRVNEIKMIRLWHTTWANS